MTMTDVEKLLALITIQNAALNNHQRAACNEAWLKMMKAEDEKAAKWKAPVFLGYGDNDGDE